MIAPVSVTAVEIVWLLPDAWLVPPADPQERQEWAARRSGGDETFQAALLGEISAVAEGTPFVIVDPDEPVVHARGSLAAWPAASASLGVDELVDTLTSDRESLYSFETVELSDDAGNRGYVVRMFDGTGGDPDVIEANVVGLFHDADVGLVLQVVLTTRNGLLFPELGEMVAEVLGNSVLPVAGESRG